MKKVILIISLLILLILPLWAANEIRFSYDSEDDPNVYVIIGRTTDPNVWDIQNTTWVTWVNANEPNYALDMSLVRKNFYDAQFPSSITTAGTYPLTIYERVAADVNVTNDLIVGEGELVWDGSAEITDYVIYTDHNGLIADICDFFGEPNYTADISVVDIRNEMDDNSTKLTNIVTDTNEMQQDQADGGRLDTMWDNTLEDTNEFQQTKGYKF